MRKPSIRAAVALGMMLTAAPAKAQFIFVIEDLDGVAGRTSALIVWNTPNRASTSQVLYGTTLALGSATAVHSWFETDHTVIVSNLLPGTTYYFQAVSTDDLGRVAYSEIISRTTLGDLHGTAAFSFTGANQNFTVPSGVSFIDVNMWGAGGEFGTADLGGADCEWMAGGGGGYVSVRLYTTPGETLTIRVGGAAYLTSGGWPNGGTGYLDEVWMGKRRYVFGMYGGAGGSSSILRDGVVVAEVGGGNGGLPCTLPIGGGYYEWPTPCSTYGNQRGTDWLGTGEAGGGGWCGGGPGNPSRSGAHYGFTPAQANGEVPGAVEHPLRQGAGEGGWLSSPTPGRVHIAW